MGVPSLTERHVTMATGARRHNIPRISHDTRENPCACGTVAGVKKARALGFSPAGFFAMRTPMLPFSVWESWSRELAAPRAADQSTAEDGPTKGDDSHLNAALASDRATLRARLMALIERPAIREALYIASPGLHDSIPIWQARPDSKRGRKIERTLTRYLGRMCYRCTPFGLFAGLSVGDFAEANHVHVPTLADCRRYLRIDNDYLFELVSDLERDDEVRQRARYVPNSTAYALGGEIRYIERHVREGRRYDELVSTEASDVLLALLRRARTGAERSQLAQVIREHVAEVSVEEATDFVTALLDDQLLVPELGPVLTGAEPADLLLQTATQLTPNAPVVAALAAAKTALAAVSEQPIGTPPTVYRDIQETLGAGARSGAFALPIQVDMYKPAPGLTLAHPVARAIANGVNLLHELAIPEPALLGKFAREFRARYGARAIPLVEALDSESGIALAQPRPPGRDTPVLGDIGFPTHAPPYDRPPALRDALARRQRHLADLIDRARRAGREEIQLSRADIDQLIVAPKTPLPDSFAVLARVTARSQAAFDAGRFRTTIVHAFGPSGANHLGRFCHGDPVLHERVRAMIAAEEALRPDAIFAEIVHLPDGRMGNVLLRPLLRDHEIPYLGISGAARDRQIAVADLLVQVSHDGFITLRSQRLGREVIPRMSTAHAYSKSKVPAYRFLCYLQHQERARYLAFAWGQLEDQASYLPRVVSGQLVLSPQRWRITGKPLARLGQARDAGLYREVQHLRRTLSLPRHIGIQAGDHVVPIDLDNILSVEGLAHGARTRGELRVVELAERGLVTTGPDGSYTHELHVPFGRSAPATSGAHEIPPVSIEAGSGAPSELVSPHLPGSNCLLVRMFTGPTTADAVLCEEISRLMARAHDQDLLERWSFIRASAPKHHLCILIHGRADVLYSRFVPELHRVAHTLIQRRAMSRMLLDTYDPALMFATDNRELVAELEALSALDSRAVLTVLPRLPGPGGLLARFQVALWWAARALQALCTSGPDRLAVARTMYHRLTTELQVHTSVAVTRALGDKYRRERANIEQLVAPTAHDPGGDIERGERGAPDLGPLVRAASVLFADVVGRFQPLHRLLRERGPTTRDTALRILIEHHSARILRSRHREQLMVLWYFLKRVCESENARALTGAADGA